MSEAVSTYKFVARVSRPANDPVMMMHTMIVQLPQYENHDPCERRLFSPPLQHTPKANSTVFFISHVTSGQASASPAGHGNEARHAQPHTEFDQNCTIFMAAQNVIRASTLGMCPTCIGMGRGGRSSLQHASRNSQSLKDEYLSSRFRFNSTEMTALRRHRWTYILKYI